MLKDFSAAAEPPKGCRSRRRGFAAHARGQGQRGHGRKPDGHRRPGRRRALRHVLHRRHRSGISRLQEAQHGDVVGVTASASLFGRRPFFRSGMWELHWSRAVRVAGRVTAVRRVR